MIQNYGLKWPQMTTSSSMTVMTSNWCKLIFGAKCELLAQCVAHGGLALRNVVCFTKKPFSQTHFCKTSSVFFSQQSYNRSARKKAERRLKSNTLACGFNFLKTTGFALRNSSVLHTVSFLRNHFVGKFSYHLVFVSKQNKSWIRLNQANSNSNICIAKTFSHQVTYLKGISFSNWWVFQSKVK